MFEKLQSIYERFHEINEKLMDPTVINDNKRYKDLMKEYKNLTPIVEKFDESNNTAKITNKTKNKILKGLCW